VVFARQRNRRPRAQFYIDYIFFGGGYQPPMYHAAFEDEGEFTVRFESVVRLFQARADLEIDGVIGPNTWGWIDLYMALRPINRALRPRIIE
jgi:peptidoglycan hydrolase-like protein with peptidoglycan-binding domain